MAQVNAATVDRQQHKVFRHADISISECCFVGCIAIIKNILQTEISLCSRILFTNLEFSCSVGHPRWDFKSIFNVNI